MSDLISSVKNKYTSNVSSVKGKEKKSDSSTTETIKNEDTFQRTFETTTSVTYNKASFISSISSKSESASSVNEIILSNEERKQSLMEMVRDQILKQSGNKNALASTLESILGLEGDLKLKPDLTMEELEEDDTWGINAVADRIMAMAESFVGGDSQMFATIKQAVLDGFADAEKQWGSELPEVCQKTMSEINNRFDKWEKELFGEEE